MGSARRVSNPPSLSRVSFAAIAGVSAQVMLQCTSVSMLGHSHGPGRSVVERRYCKVKVLGSISCGLVRAAHGVVSTPKAPHVKMRARRTSNPGRKHGACMIPLHYVRHAWKAPSCSLATNCSVCKQIPSCTRRLAGCRHVGHATAPRPGNEPGPSAWHTGKHQPLYDHGRQSACSQTRNFVKASECCTNTRCWPYFIGSSYLHRGRGAVGGAQVSQS